MVNGGLYRRFIKNTFFPYWRKLPNDPDYIKTIEDYHDLIKQKFPELSKKDVIKKGEDILKLYKNR